MLLNVKTTWPIILKHPMLNSITWIGHNAISSKNRFNSRNTYFQCIQSGKL